MQVHTCYHTARGVKSLSTAESVQSPFFLLITRRECSLVCKGPLNSRLCPDSLAERLICKHVQPEQRVPFADTSPLPFCGYINPSILLFVHSRVLLILVIALFFIDWLFISSRSLLNISCIFSILVSSLFICNSILFSRFCIICSIIIVENSR